MSTWKQEVAAAVTPIDGVNAVSADLIWRIRTDTDPDSPVPSGATITEITAEIAVKAPAEVSARFVDGKNIIAGDHVTEIAYLTYLAARNADAENAEILASARPLSGGAFGLAPGVDALDLAGTAWRIIAVAALGMMNDDVTGEAVPAKLRLTLRKD